MVRFGMAAAVLALMAAPLFAQESTEELKKELQQLRAEVDGLKAVNQSKEIPASGRIDKDAMAADDNPVMTMFKGTKLSGFVDAGYQFSFNTLNTSRVIAPPALDNVHNPVRIFDNRDNSFYLHEAHIQLERLASKDMIVGYHIELAAGHDPSVYDGAAFDLQEGWLQIMAPLGDGLDIRVGKMATLCGYEVLENMNNMNYSRGMLFGLLQPFTHTGIRASYGMGGANHDMVSFTLGFNNGLNAGDRFADDNHGKAVEFQLAVKPIKDLYTAINIHFGNDTKAPATLSGRTDQKFYVFDIVASYTMDKLTFGLNIDWASIQGVGDLIGNGTFPSGRGALSGLALYTKYQFSDAVAEAIRIEYFSDAHGLIGFTGAAGSGSLTPNTANDSGDGARIFEFTLTTEVKVASNLILRFEIRHDDSNQHTFRRDTKAARGDNTLGFEAIMPF